MFQGTTSIAYTYIKKNLYFYLKNLLYFGEFRKVLQKDFTLVAIH
jgi:hypothetical protein